jgi:hypothetical protein
MKEAIERKNARRLSREDFYCFMNGGGNFGPLEEIAGGFQTRKYRFTSIEEARAFFYAFVIDYIKPFNDDKEIRPYLRHFPLIADNFSLVVQFQDERCRQLEPPYIGSIWLQRGAIYYFAETPSTNKPSEVLYSETFAEAEEILNKSRS